MKQGILICSILAFGGMAWAHSWKEGEPLVFNEELRAHLLEEWQASHAPRQSATPKLVANGATPGVGKAPAQAAPFVAFAPKVEAKWDDRFLYIESIGLPSHNMMVGITTWQQQVPLPQAYFGDNAWRIPLKPVPAKTPQVIENHFLRGAIAIAVNGIPIFNPQNNRGEVAHEIGELDQWGGHCGRADDYHYHIAPLHLQTAVGKGMPIAYALDGYPIYGLTEPDGSPVGALDECHGHEDRKIGYHYHASLKRPYVQSAFHGEVKEAEGQVDPQPRANPVRPSLQALRGARITGFESRGKDSYVLSYEVSGENRRVSYTIKGDGTYAFQFDNGREGVTEETYTAGGGRRGGGGPGGAQPQGGPEGRGKGPGKGGREGEGEMRPQPPGAGPSAPAVVEGLVDVNGDGMITAQEFAESAKAVAAKKGVPLAAALAAAREQFGAADHDRNGHLDRAEYEELTGAAPSRGGSGETRMRRESEERPPQGGEGRGGGGGKGGKGAFVEREDQPRSSDGRFLLTSPVMEDMTEMPVEYTGDGEAATLPLAWRSAPAGTQSYALIMDHAAPGGDMKWYWTLHDLPKDLTALPRNVKNVGRVGTGFRGQVGYEPPHSKGPGAKVYVITLYALSAPVEAGGAPGRSELLAAMKGKVLASSSLRVIHTSSGAGGAGSGERPRGGAMNEAPRAGVERGEGGADAPSSRGTAPPTPPAAGSGSLRPLDNIFAPAGGSAGGAAMAKGGSAGERPAEPVPTRGEGKRKGGGKGKGGPPGLVKPSLEDTTRLNVYADNWFMLYVNGRLVAVDPIPFTPHNVVSVDFLPEYPMTIAVLAKDNADPGTGMEYGTSIGDGGFILKFADGTVTNASWKAKSFFHGPESGDTADPKVMQEPLPAQWWAVNFDDSTWRPAKEYTEEQVDPKQPYFDSDFAGARFIWTEDLALDNTVIFRTKVDRPGWAPRWNTKPDLDVTGAPLN